MPDGDKIPVGIYGRWRKVLRSFDARESVERIADDVAGALASDVRRAGGLVGLGVAGITQGAAAPVGGPAPAPATAQAPGDSSAEEFTGAVALALGDHLALTSSPQAAYRLAERLVTRLAWSRFERMIIRLVGDKKYAAVELYARFREVLSDEAIGNLVSHILRHPTGEGLRAPNKRLHKLPMKELLDTDLGSL